MKGRTRSAKEKKFHDLLCQVVGCPACLADTGLRNTHVSVHHIDGRTKPYAHWYVLALCAGHHQDGYGEKGQIAVHPHKARFEEKYGKQMDILRQSIQHLVDQGHQLPAEALAIL